MLRNREAGLRFGCLRRGPFRIDLLGAVGFRSVGHNRLRGVRYLATNYVARCLVGSRLAHADYSRL
jgi:hypothetical protein